jgi:uncharacterized membrane protein YidH (DUF202 family)
VLQPNGDHREATRLAGWVAYRAWRATAVALVVVGVAVGWLAGTDRGGPAAALGVTLALALVLTGVVTLIAGRRRWRSLNEAITAGRPFAAPAARLPLLVSSVVAAASLLLAGLALAGLRPGR